MDRRVSHTGGMDGQVRQRSFMNPPLLSEVPTTLISHEGQTIAGRPSCASRLRWGSVFVSLSAIAACPNSFARPLTTSCRGVNARSNEGTPALLSCDTLRDC